MAWRHSYLQQRSGGEPTVFARTEARAGYSLARLAPPDFAWHDATITDRPYLNWLRAVQGAHDAATALGQPFELAAIPWIQGQADLLMSRADYKARMAELMARMQSDAMTITGQHRKPQVLVVTPPGTIWSGQWELIQAQVELCHERPDYTLCGAGWALPQLDNTHFTAEACVALGEIFQLGLAAYLSGRPYSAPYIKDAARDGSEIRFWIGGDYPVRNETGIVTRRHYLSDLTTPVPHFGFEYSGAPIASAVLNPDGRSGTITLAAAAPGRLWYAGHNSDRRLQTTDPEADESCNRGTLIADVEIAAIYSVERLTLGVSTWYKDL